MDAALLALVLVDIQSASASAIFFCFCLSFRLIVFLPLCVSPCAQATIAQTSRGSRAEQDTRQSEANDVLLFQAPAIKGKKKQTETRESRTREKKKDIRQSAPSPTGQPVLSILPAILRIPFASSSAASPAMLRLML
ncbi:hypothetical protein H0G86_007799 [Trichoderma simmonsii]|uniref:Secreted protein n=1 Tax=Trichoderma simmonsii TaxID=1491479 RepID=A0A8G0LJD5_9HYPO|nr:hypothetical protein H0G86_007799 [Trichoderma simmonsii]